MWHQTAPATGTKTPLQHSRYSVWEGVVFACYIDCRPFRAAGSSSATQICHTFYITRRFNTAFTADRHWSLTWATWIQSTWNNPVSLTQFPFQYFLHNTPGLPTGPFRLETTNSVHISRPSHPYCTPCLAPLPYYKTPNNPVDSANHNISHYTVFPNLPSLPPSLAQYSQTPSAFTFFPYRDRPCCTPTQNNRHNYLIGTPTNAHT